DRPLAVRQPGVPVAVERIVDDVGLHLVVFPLFRAFLVARVVGRIGPGLDDAVDGFAVGAPFEAAGRHRQGPELLRFGAGWGDEVNLGDVAGALGDEGDRFSVRRPDGAGTLALGARELLLRLAVGGQQPDVGAAVVVLHAVARDLDGDPLTVRRDR